jgi:hypothetical protein
MDKLKTIEGFIEKEDIDFFINWIDENYEDTTKFRQRLGVAFNKGLASRAVFPDEKPATLFKDIEEICMKYANKFMDAQNEFLPSDETQYFYGFSLTRLTKDIQLRIHQDVHGDFPSLSYSGVLYLNDDYEGGDATFLEEFTPESFFPLYEDSMGGLSFKPKAGDLSLFPSSLWHGGKRITDGVKYAIIFWATSDATKGFEGFDSDRVLELINYKPIAAE